jgi:methyl-galactoside transport system substrate-binding protein
MGAYNNENRKLFRYAVHAISEASPYLYEPDATICPSCGCGGDSDGDADSQPASELPSTPDDICRAQAFPVLTADGKTALKYDGPWGWTCARDGAAIRITPTKGMPLTFVVDAADATLARPDGETRKRNFRVQLQNTDGSPCATGEPARIMLTDATGLSLIFDAASGIVSLAKNAGIPVIFFNREVSDSVVASYDKCSFIGTNAKEAGYLQGDMIGDYLVNNFSATDLNGDGRISYVMFMGEKGNNEAIYRTTYSVENANKKLVASGKPELSFYDPQNTDKYLLDREGKWSAQAANEYMTTILSSFNTANGNAVELVICNNDGMAEGAISALNVAGYNTGAPGSVTVPVFGVDATSAARELIAGGKMTGTIKQDADGMADAIATVIGNHLEGKAVTDGMDKYPLDATVKKFRVPYSVYSKENNS